MALVLDLVPASYEDEPFLVPSESEQGGKKVVIHEYPGSDKRFVEELGRLLPVFSITAIINGPDVVERRRRLTAKLVRGGNGKLVHPYVGEVTVVCVDHNIQSTQTKIGEVRLNLDFAQTSNARSVTAVAGGKTRAFEAAGNARAARDRAAEARLKTITNADSAATIGSRLSEAIDQIQGQVSNVVTPATDGLNAVTRNIITTRGDILSIVRTPQKLTRALRGIFDTMLSLGETPADLRREWQNLTNFGAPVRFLSNGQRSRTLGSVRAPIQRTTLKRRLEDDTLRVLDQSIRVEALINSLEAEADAEFATDDDLAATRQRLADDFDRIVQNQDDVVATSSLGDEVLTDANVTEPSATVSEAIAFSSGLALDPKLRAALDDLRVATFELLGESEKNAFRITSFELGTTDIQLATYQVYGSVDNLDEIAALNGGQNLGFIREPIKGLVQ